MGVYSSLIIMCISTQWGFVLFYFNLFENNIYLFILDSSLIFKNNKKIKS